MKKNFFLAGEAIAFLAGIMVALVGATIMMAIFLVRLLGFFLFAR